jgi:hypothetical protein
LIRTTWRNFSSWQAAAHSARPKPRSARIITSNDAGSSALSFQSSFSSRAFWLRRSFGAV